jgi:hypothetical protein
VSSIGRSCRRSPTSTVGPTAAGSDARFLMLPKLGHGCNADLQGSDDRLDFCSRRSVTVVVLGHGCLHLGVGRDELAAGVRRCTGGGDLGRGLLDASHLGLGIVDPGAGQVGFGTAGLLRPLSSGGQENTAVRSLPFALVARSTRSGHRQGHRSEANQARFR